MEKPEDCCYTFWIGNLLKLLDAEHLVNKTQLEGSLLMCQGQHGGLMKFPYSDQSDPIHAGQGIMGGMIFGLFGLKGHGYCPESCSYVTH